MALGPPGAHAVCRSTRLLGSALLAPMGPSSFQRDHGRQLGRHRRITLCPFQLPALYHSRVTTSSSQCPPPRSRREGLERYQTQTRFSLRAAAPAGPLTSPKQAVIHPKALGLNIEVSRGQEPVKAQPPPIGDLEGLRLAKNSLCFPLLSESSGFSWFVWFGRRKWVFAIDLTQILERHEGRFCIFGKTKESKELNTQR